MRIPESELEREHLRIMLQEASPCEPRQDHTGVEQDKPKENTMLKCYRVDLTRGGEEIRFFCLADDKDHAVEQAADAYPHGESFYVDQIDADDYPYELHD